MQIRNLEHLNRSFDLKRIIQKFTLYFPYYAEVYEIMGDLYFKEEKYELALNLYDKVLKLVQNKRVSDKTKKVKETFINKKTKNHALNSESWYDITENVLSSDEEIILRERELRQIVEVLISKSRRNILLVGGSGVGKTALIKLLAMKINDEDVPELLKDKKIREINFISLLIGSKYRGQFEEKIVKFLNEFKSMNAILILENIHLMMSTGTARGTSMDLVNILKQFLKENSIQVIATTNYEEFKNSIEKDNALMAFFQKLHINEMSPDDTKLILSNLAKDSFSKDNIVVSEEIIGNIIENAKINIKEKKLPDSAIMIFERCIAKVKYKIFSGDDNIFELTSNDVIEVLSDLLNIPETNISASLHHRLLNLKKNLLTRIMGQDSTIERVTANIITSKLDFDIKRNRPVGVFLFIGPTGVGKTETAIALAETLYGSEDFLIRIDMSEYMEKFTYSRFVGAAPGYVGYYDSNQLTDKVRQNPFSVILLDEVEKADLQLLNIFLQVFDAGRLTDARGNVIDFSHTTIIMTSNIGTSLFSQSQLGYHTDLEKGNVTRSALLKMLKKYFSIEFLNRIDEILIFSQLQEEDIKKIINLHLDETRIHLEKEGKELLLKDDAMDYLVKYGYSKEYGARNIARTIKFHILEKIAAFSLQSGWSRAKYVACYCDNGELEVNLEYDSDRSLDNSEVMEQAGAD